MHPPRKYQVCMLTEILSTDTVYTGKVFCGEKDYQSDRKSDKRLV